MYINWVPPQPAHPLPSHPSFSCSIYTAPESFLHVLQNFTYNFCWITFQSDQFLDPGHCTNLFCQRREGDKDIQLRAEKGCLSQQRLVFLWGWNVCGTTALKAVPILHYSDFKPFSTNMLPPPVSWACQSVHGRWNGWRQKLMFPLEMFPCLTSNQAFPGERSWHPGYRPGPRNCQATDLFCSWNTSSASSFIYRAIHFLLWRAPEISK